MELHATIKETKDEKFIVWFGQRSPKKKIFEDFESAYVAACEYVNWNMEWVEVRVFPDYVNEIIEHVYMERNRILFKAKFDIEKETYLRLKDKFEGDVAYDKKA